ncbi:MAG: HNH endonuclease, partial [Candidatus Krumholzibacteriia bacterium]
RPNRAAIAPSVRAAVLARDGYRCRTPGCSRTRFLKVHHIVPRARGGGNALENLITYCSACHRHRHGAAESKDM